MCEGTVRLWHHAQYSTRLRTSHALCPHGALLRYGTPQDLHTWLDPCVIHVTSSPLVVYPNSADNSIAPKTGYNAPISRHVGGGNTMVSHLFYYQLALLALVWLCLMVHVTWPKRGVTSPPAS